MASGCASRATSSSTQAPADKSRVTRTELSAYTYSTPSVVEGGFKVLLTTLELTRNYAFQAGRPRDTSPGSRGHVILFLESTQEASGLIWRQSKNAKILEVLDETGKNVLISSIPDYGFRKIPFQLTGIGGISSRDDWENGQSKILLSLTSLPRSIQTLRGEAYVEVAPKLATGSGILTNDPIEFDVCEGVRAKAWKVQEPLHNRTQTYVNVEVRFNAQRRATNAVFQSIELSNINSAREVVKIGEGINELTQSFENDEVVVRTTTDRVKADGGTISVRVTVVPEVRAITIPFAFGDLPGSEP
ncbi:MAG: hypothetical protein U0640_04060 [Phycisphaerales bacterium]